jgi:hypothetical protein
VLFQILAGALFWCIAAILFVGLCRLTSRLTRWMQRRDWRHVPPPNWACKRNTVNVW